MILRRSKIAVRKIFYENITKLKSGCWRWNRSPSSRYGRLNFNGKSQPVHRVSFLMFKGPIPKGKEVCHKCDFTKCVRPSHLFLGTHRDNLMDMCRKGRHGATLKPKEWSEKCFGKKRSNPGEKNGSVKLTQSQAQEIKNETGSWYRSYFRNVIGKTQYYRIKRGKNWKMLK